MDKLPLNSNPDDQQNAKPSFKSQRLSFFWFLAAADEDLLRECPSTEQYKQASIGAAILFTAVAAALSGYFAFYLLLNENWFIALPVAIFWSMLIFNLDRFMVGSMRKDVEGNRLKEIKMASPRLLLATIIALLISRPIEVKIFETQINKEQIENNESSIARISRTRQSIINADTDYLSVLQNQRSALEEDKNNCKKAPNYNEAYLTWEQCNNRKNSLEQKRNAKNVQIDEIKKNPRYLTQVMKDLNGDGISNEFQLQLTPDGQNRIRDLESEKGEIDIALGKLNCEESKAKYERICIEYRKSIDQKITKIDENVNTQNEIIVKGVVTKNGVINNLSNADSLHSKSFLGKLEALERAKAKNSTIKYSSWFIMLLFFILEIAPLIVKILVERSAYDSLLQLKEQKIIFNSETDLSELKSNAQRRLRILQDDDGKLLETERQMNKDVMEKIRDAQTEVSFKLIEAWKDEESEKIEKNRAKSVKERVKTSK